MSSIQASAEHAAELRLDYRDLVAGQLVIVIHGLPTADHQVLPPDAREWRAVAAGSSRNGGHGPDSSPLVEEAEAIRKATGYAPALLKTLLVAVWEGRELLASELIATTIEQATTEDVGRAIALADYAKAVLHNGLGRYEDAVTAARQVRAQDDLDLFGRACFELVEACARSGIRAPATEALHDLDEDARASTDDWALAVRARSAALLSNGNAAETLYREAIERFERGRATLHLPRTQLVYGEWLRRENRRVDAREQLRSAHEAFSECAAGAFAERARRELLATGESARERTDDTRDLLTPQEAQIARLARDGFSNPEIGAQLFISPRTVQYHLRKVFRKLDITSRNHLGRVPFGHFSSA